MNTDTTTLAQILNNGGLNRTVFENAVAYALSSAIRGDGRGMIAPNEPIHRTAAIDILAELSSTVRDGLRHILGDREPDEPIESIWSSHPDLCPEDWAGECSEGDTRLGYWEWVAAKVAAEQEPKEN